MSQIEMVVCLRFRTGWIVGYIHNPQAFNDTADYLPGLKFI